MAKTNNKATMWDLFKNGPNFKMEPLKPMTQREEIELENRKEKIRQDALIQDIGEFNKITFDI